VRLPTLAVAGVLSGLLDSHQSKDTMCPVKRQPRQRRWDCRAALSGQCRRV